MQTKQKSKFLSVLDYATFPVLFCVAIYFFLGAFKEVTDVMHIAITKSNAEWYGDKLGHAVGALLKWSSLISFICVCAIVASIRDRVKLGKLKRNLES